ncbi:hypothetical protein ADMFC3_12050 [Geovibrio sp. ADMFC3]|jgi:hypothetical protein|nr:hypothetical protein [Deferribacteraceae bacterium]
MNSMIFRTGITMIAISGIFMALFEYFNISVLSAAQMMVFLFLSFTGMAAASIKAKRKYYAGTE